MTERILTQHPQGKAGVRIAKDKYEEMRRALLILIPQNQQGVAFQELPEALLAHLDPIVYPPKASVKWYLTTVKQDLEARGLIEQVPGQSPQHLRQK